MFISNKNLFSVTWTKFILNMYKQLNKCGCHESVRNEWHTRTCFNIIRHFVNKYEWIEHIIPVKMIIRFTLILKLIRIQKACMAMKQRKISDVVFVKFFSFLWSLVSQFISDKIRFQSLSVSSNLCELFCKKAKSTNKFKQRVDTEFVTANGVSWALLILEWTSRKCDDANLNFNFPF